MKKKKIIVIVSIGAFLLLAWSPWITKTYAREKIMSRQDFFEVHHFDYPNANFPSDQVGVKWLPFMRFVSTYESGWFVSFFGMAEPDSGIVPFPIGRVSIYVNDVEKSAATIKAFVVSVDGNIAKDIVYEKDNMTATMFVYIPKKEKEQLQNILSKEATDGIVSGAKIFYLADQPKVTKNIEVEIGLVDVRILNSESL